MAYWSPRQWDDFKATFPNQTRSPAAIAVWSIILIADLVLGGWVLLKLDISINLFNDQLEYFVRLLIILAVAAVAFFVENALYSAFRRLFWS